MSSSGSNQKWCGHSNMKDGEHWCPDCGAPPGPYVQQPDNTPSTSVVWTVAPDGDHYVVEKKAAPTYPCYAAIARCATENDAQIVADALNASEVAP